MLEPQFKREQVAILVEPKRLPVRPSLERTEELKLRFAGRRKAGKVSLVIDHNEQPRFAAGIDHVDELRFASVEQLLERLFREFPLSRQTSNDLEATGIFVADHGYWILRPHRCPFSWAEADNVD
jgi:hypothetical protein